METTTSLPESDLSAAEIAASTSLIEEDFSESPIVTPSFGLVDGLLKRLSLIFGKESDRKSDFEEKQVCTVYVNLLNGYTDKQVSDAFVKCGRTMKRMPFPSDLIEAIESQKVDMATIEFKFEIGRRVTIEANGLTGCIQGLFVGKHGEKQVLVEYADKNGVIHREYFDEESIEI